jgi:S-methylmethionine-dependent homocysteine/selenocysteine methylase
LATLRSRRSASIASAPALAEPLLTTAASLSDKPLVVYPSSGEHWDVEGRRWHDGDGTFEFGQAALAGVRAAPV